MSDSQAVFLSYASQDAEPARRICEALRAAGVEVWFDQNELTGGDAWDAKIRKQIKECALFVPIVSVATQARREGYFRLEWKLADDRTHLMAKGTPFLVPVCIDDTKDWDALVPDSFMSVQWTRLPGGETPPKFCDRVQALLRGEIDGGRGRPTPPSAPPSAGSGDPALRPKVGRRVPAAAWATVAVAAIVFGGYFWLKRSTEPTPIPASNAGAGTRPPASEKAPAVAAAAEFSRDPDLQRAMKLLFARDAVVVDFALAEDIVKPLLAARPNDPEVATVAAVIAQEFLTRGFDTSQERRAGVQRLTERAVQLAPDNPDALAALGRYLAFIQAQLPRAESLLRRAIELKPDEPRYYRTLLGILEPLKPAAETEAFVARMSARFPREVLVRYDIARYYKDRNEVAAMEQAMDETLALAPLTSAMVWKCWLALEAHGDVPAMKGWLERVPERQRGQTRVASAFATYAEISGDAGEAIKLLSDLPDTWLSDFDFTGPKALLLGNVLTIDGRKDLARLQYEAALAEIKRGEERSPTDLRMRRAEMWTLLGLGRRDEARAALQILVQAVDRPYRVTMNNSWWHGPVRAAFLLGDRDQAVALLREAAVEPPSRMILRSQFHVDPRMAPFRDDPDLAALLAEPEKPKTGDGGPSFAKATDGTPVAGDQPPIDVSAAASAKVDPKSVAVLAFDNLSDDKANEYFSDGISEELLNALAKVPGLKVTARTSAFYFKGKNATAPEIGATLHVAHLVEGSVQKSGNRVKIAARLSRAATGEQLWSANFTRDLADVFAVQSEIALTIVEQLRGQLTGEDAAKAKAEIQAQVQAATKGGTKNAEAHQLYLQGRFFANQATLEALGRAEELLQRATRLDPQFAVAWAALARAAVVHAGFSSDRRQSAAAKALARRAADRALALEPNLAAAHLARANIQLAFDFDWTGAAESVRRAQLLAPADADVVFAAAALAYIFGRLDQAEKFGREAVSLDPVNPLIRLQLARTYAALRRFPEAEIEFRRLTELSPTSAWAHTGLGHVYVAQGRFDEAVAEAQLSAAGWAQLFVLAQARRGQKKTAEAGAALAQLVQSYAEVASFQIAQVYAFRRENDRAFEWLERAWRDRDPGVRWCKPDLTLATLHADPRWSVFLHKLGLADDQLK